MRFSNVSGIKILGRAIGAARSVEPSDFDGDGDGFLTGPDGQDNIPAPKRVVEAAKRAGRVADILKPTDDLMEVRKSGRPWKPLLLDYMPDDMKKEFQSVYNDVLSVMHANGAKWKKVEEELLKKYAKPGQRIMTDIGAPNAEVFDLIPKEEIEKHANIFNQYLIESAYGTRYTEHIELNRRIREFDEKYRAYVKDAFERERQKAIDAGQGDKFDRAFSKFKRTFDDRYRYTPASSMIVEQGANSPAARAWNMGYQGKKLGNQFEVADREARKLVDNPDKRIVAFIDAGMIGAILDDGRMKNFFEAKRNVFQDDMDAQAVYDKWGARERRQRYMAARLNGEQDILGLPAGGYPSKNRPIYALLMPDGFLTPDAESEDAFAYGGVGIVMRHAVEERSHFTGGDSLNWKFGSSSPINDPSWTSMMPRQTLAMDAAWRRESGKEAYISNYGYVEAQIMGGVSVGDIAYVTVKDDKVLSDEIKSRLEEMGIPVVVHNSLDIYEEPEDLKIKAEDKPSSYVLFATYGNRKLFVPSEKPKDDDMHGMISVGSGERRRVENVAALLKFGNWELV